MGMTKTSCRFLRFWPSNSITEHPSKIELPLVTVSPVPQVSISLAPANLENRGTNKMRAIAE